MICQFTFENYKAFKNESTLDFSAERISEYESSLVVDVDNKEKAVPVIAIYGPNGGGKSTVLDALNYLRNMVLRVIVLTKLHDVEEKYQSVIHEWSSITFRECIISFPQNFRICQQNLILCSVRKAKNSAISFQC